MKHFYSHLINLEELFVKLEELRLRDEHRDHLSLLIDSTLHHVILDLILTNLNKQDKIIFVEMIRTDKNHHEIMEFLVIRIDNIEGKIKETVNSVKLEFLEDIKEL